MLVVLSTIHSMPLGLASIAILEKLNSKHGRCERLTIALCKDVQFRKGDAYAAIYASAIVAFVIGTVRIYELGFVEHSI